MPKRRPEPPPGKSWCGSCRKFKPLDSFYRLRSGPHGRYPQCKACYRERFESKREQIQEGRRRWERRLLHSAINAYGGECSCCGEREVVFLTVVAPRNKKPVGATGWWLKKNDYPKGFYVLCHNCEGARRAHGECPHERLIVLGR